MGIENLRFVIQLVYCIDGHRKTIDLPFKKHIAYMMKQKTIDLQFIKRIAQMGIDAQLCVGEAISDTKKI